MGIALMAVVGAAGVRKAVGARQDQLRYRLRQDWIVPRHDQTLEEIGRIPMAKLSGKYNVWNKVHGSEGTDH